VEVKSRKRGYDVKKGREERVGRMGRRGRDFVPVVKIHKNMLWCKMAVYRAVAPCSSFS